MLFCELWHFKVGLTRMASAFIPRLFPLLCSEWEMHAGVSLRSSVVSRKLFSGLNSKTEHGREVSRKCILLGYESWQGALTVK